MRLKIIAGNLVAVVLVAAVSFFVVRSQLGSAIEERLEGEIDNDRILFDRSWRLSAADFLEHTLDRARTRDVRDAFAGLDTDSRRRRAHEVSNRIADWFADPSRGRAGAPDVVLVTDETGAVVARDTDPNRMYQVKLARELGTLRQTLEDGSPRHDVWRKEDERKILQTAIAPIRSDAGTILGALVVAYDLSNGLATSESEVLGREVAFVAEGALYGSSLSRSTVDALQETLFGRLRESTEAVLSNDTAVSPAWQASLDGATYDGITASLPLSPSTGVAYVMLANRSDALAIMDTTFVVLWMGILGALLVIVYGFVLGGAFTRPIEQMEEGVLAIINGRTDLRLDIDSAELGGLAYRINQLVNVFTGTAEEDAEGRVSAPPSPPAAIGGGAAVWRDETFAEQAAPTPAAASAGADVVDDPHVAAALAAEPEDAYYARLYREYVGAKQALGEDVSNIPQDRFAQRLRGNEAALAKKHGCRLVRFQVETRGNQVVLKPVLIR